ncbi:MAG: [FeFe] hydrogenase H-cluster radical SAM maturase HydE [Defluviitaleaceae bacterium]|nr:[FeFe] hydrogenase H-cluster radical SAM maturase HydE [Defluviitaleaceae bacterium]
MKKLIDKLEKSQVLTRDEIKELLAYDGDYLFERARYTARSIYGNKIFARGLIEVTNYCKCDCYYCGLRRSNSSAVRYRLTKSQVMDCCKMGYNLGFRTFVLQGGEDGYYTDEILVELISGIKSQFPDCAVTLSIGERSYESYKQLFDAGADRYLLRHETANDAHYSKLHPPEMLLSNRKKCLLDLKEIGYQVGCGFMVGTPGQTLDNIVDDLLFIKELDPAMVGVGPFVPHSATPFAENRPGDLRLTLNILAMLRLMKPNLLIPATTALGSIDSKGRELAVLAGANVIMPNLSPVDARKKYLLYNNKISTDGETADNFSNIKRSMKDIGYDIISARGDYFDL